jgi:uncharacterized membrane protein YeiH
VLAATVVNPPLWIELSAIVTGALTGAVFAGRRGLDVVGVLAIAIVSGLGGGLIRDILLSTIPAALRDPAYLLAVVLAAILGAYFASAVRYLRWPMIGLDSLSLGLFAVIGTQKALSFRLPVAAAILLGVITGIGGGLLRDLFTGVIPPEAFQRGSPFASVAALAAGGYAFLVQVVGTTKLVAEIVMIAIVLLVRSVAIWRGWTSPAPRDLTPSRLRRRTDLVDPPREDPGGA